MGLTGDATDISIRFFTSTDPSWMSDTLLIFPQGAYTARIIAMLIVRCAHVSCPKSLIVSIGTIGHSRSKRYG